MAQMGEATLIGGLMVVIGVVIVGIGGYAIYTSGVIPGTSP